MRSNLGIWNHIINQFIDLECNQFKIISAYDFISLSTKTLYYSIMVLNKSRMLGLYVMLRPHGHVMWYNDPRDRLMRYASKVTRPFRYGVSLGHTAKLLCIKPHGFQSHDANNVIYQGHKAASMNNASEWLGHTAVRYGS